MSGASRGLGQAVAIELARLGAHCVITARTQGGLEETDDAIRAAGGAATIIPLDLRKGADVDMLGPSIAARFGRLDILVAAAATLGPLTPVGHILPDAWAEVLDVNLLATWHLIRTAAPLLVAAPAGRGVFVTDARARHPRAYWGPYATTKAAMEHLVLTFAEESRNTRLRVNLFDPGVMATRLRRRGYPAEDPAPLKKPAEIAPLLVPLCLPTETRHGLLIGRSPSG